MSDPDCIFCKIVAGELPAQIIEQDERTVTFMDIAPATSAAVPLSRMFACDACAAATPRIKLEVETIPSLAPRTAARNQFDR